MLATYVAHPQVVIDPARPIPDWGLSEEGRIRAEAAARRPWARGLARASRPDRAPRPALAERSGNG